MLEYDTSWIGKEFDRYTYNVTKDEIIEFAQSIGETNPLYTDEEYATRIGWGHTSLSHLVRYLGDAAPARAVMVHHDPDHDDAQLGGLLERARAASGRDELELGLGHEGLELTLP